MYATRSTKVIFENGICSTKKWILFLSTSHTCVSRPSNLKKTPCRGTSSKKHTHTHKTDRHTVDGWNPKQPPDMYKTPINNGTNYHIKLVNAGFLNHQQYHPNFSPCFLVFSGRVVYFHFVLFSTKAWWIQWMEWWHLGTAAVGSQLVKIVGFKMVGVIPDELLFFSPPLVGSPCWGEIFSEKWSWCGFANLGFCKLRCFWSKESMWVDRSQISFDVTLSYEHFPFDQQVLDFWGWQWRVVRFQWTKSLWNPTKFAQRISRSLSHDSNLSRALWVSRYSFFFVGHPSS